MDTTLPLVSIIMPVYNARQYVEDAIRSILEQDYINFELLLIDDGATDGSREVCDAFAEKDTRIVVVHQKNGGICNARNRGLELAKGKYIAFCDHDDLYLPGHLQCAVQAAERDHAQMVKASFRVEFWYDGVCKKTVTTKTRNEVLSTQKLIDRYPDMCIVERTLWNGIYLRDIIEKNHIRFDETVRYGLEDVLFNIDILKYADGVTMLEDVCYIHYIRKEQSTSQKYHVERFQDIIKTADAEKALIRKRGGDIRDSLLQSQRWYVTIFAKDLVDSECPMSFAEKKEQLQYLSRLDGYKLECPRIYCVKYFFRNPKHGVVSLLFNAHLFGLLIILVLMRRKVLEE